MPLSRLPAIASFAAWTFTSAPGGAGVPPVGAGAAFAGAPAPAALTSGSLSPWRASVRRIRRATTALPALRWSARIDSGVESGPAVAGATGCAASSRCGSSGRRSRGGRMAADATRRAPRRTRAARDLHSAGGRRGLRGAPRFPARARRHVPGTVIHRHRRRRGVRGPGADRPAVDGERVADAGFEASRLRRGRRRRARPRSRWSRGAPLLDAARIGAARRRRGARRALARQAPRGRAGRRRAAPGARRRRGRRARAWRPTRRARSWP